MLVVTLTAIATKTTLSIRYIWLSNQTRIITPKKVLYKADGYAISDVFKEQ